MNPDSKPAVTGPDADRIARILEGDEAAFTALVEELHASLVRQARVYVRTHALAEEVVQDTWVAVVEGLHRFEGRSALKTWIFRILANQARTRAVREGRTVPFSSLAEAADGEVADSAPAVQADRFNDRGRWIEPPRDWQDMSAEATTLGSETMRHLQVALEDLPPAQRSVVTLRDVEGWSSAEVCNALDVSETNQRVLLHRGRSRLRKALAGHLELPESPTSKGKR